MWSLVCLFSIILVSSLDAYSCPTGTFTHGTKCYGFLGMDFDRNTSMSLCQATYGYNARLVDPLTATENLFVTQQVQTHASWHTWLQYRANGNYFVDDKGHYPIYTNFAVGEPFSTANGYCATIGLNGYWYAQQCSEAHTALCEFDIVPPSTTPLPVTTVTPRPAGYPPCVQKYLNFAPCQSGWDYYPPTCSCFKIISNTTYYNAMNVCRSLGAKVASVHGFGEAAFIQRLAVEANSNNYWSSTASGRDNVIVGLKYDTSSSTFKWDDLTSFDFYEGFAPSEPAQLTAQGQIIVNNPMGYATYMRFFDCSYQTCRYAACKKYV